MQVIKAKNTAKKTVKKLKKLNSLVVDYVSFYLVITCIIKASSNDKTGDLIQTYLIDKKLMHEETVNFGSKCLECAMLSKCYVNKDKLSVRNALKRLESDSKTTSYELVSFDEALKHLKKAEKGLRLGTYGDPSILPLSDIEKLVNVSRMHTGYTHFWREIPTKYSRFLMASTECNADDLFSESLGYRAFRVLLKDKKEHTINDNFIECLNSSHDKTCLECKLCNGNDKGSKKSIYNHEH